MLQLLVKTVHVYFYWDCEEASWATDEVTGQGYTLSNWDGTGIFQDTSCQAGFCDDSWFYYELAQYYSGATNLLNIEDVVTASELTMVQSVGQSGSNMFFLGSTNCPGCNLNTSYSCDFPLGTIAGYSFEAPSWAGGNPGSCYTAEQVLDFGTGHIFATWNELVAWHNFGTSSSNGPNINCPGSQINLILPSHDYQYVYDALNNGPNAGGSGDSMDPDAGENWIYYYPFAPNCDGYQDCECEENTTSLGTYPNAQACEDDTETCCGEGSGAGDVYGCMDATACLNYNSLATIDDGTCCYECGCTDPTAYNYDASIDPLCDDGSCIDILPGCSDPSAFNYNSAVNQDDGTCVYVGCLDNLASNYLEYPNNSTTSYTWAGFTYTGGPTLACTSCCLFPSVNDWDCHTSPYGQYYFQTTPNNVGVLNYNPWSNTPSPGLTEASTLVQAVQNGNSCQTMYSLPNSYDDPNNVLYIWSNATAGGPFEEMNSFYWWNALSAADYVGSSTGWWNANNVVGKCQWSQTQIDDFYNSVGYVSPAGTGGFQIGTDDPAVSGTWSGARPMMIERVYAWHTTWGAQFQISINLSANIAGFGTWAGIRQFMINNYGYGTTKPSIAGMDFYDAQQVMQADGEYELRVDFWHPTCDDGPENFICVQNGGPYSSCNMCNQVGNAGGSCGSCPP